MSGYFVTSTGTEIGKTLVSKYLVKASSRNGTTGYYKPVASGCESTDWGYRSPDEAEIIDGTGLAPSDVHASYRFDAPLSPDKAAEREGESIDPDRILEDHSTLSDQYQTLIVEGIGGVAVPFTRDYDVSNLASDLALPVLLVASSYLGTISFTRTAMTYLAQVDVEPTGILLTPREGRDIETTNRDHLREFYSNPSIRLVPDVSETDGSSLVQLLEETVL